MVMGHAHSLVRSLGHVYCPFMLLDRVHCPFMLPGHVHCPVMLLGHARVTGTCTLSSDYTMSASQILLSLCSVVVDVCFFSISNIFYLMAPLPDNNFIKWHRLQRNIRSNNVYL